MRPQFLPSLTAHQAEQVGALVARDPGSAAPLSEQALLRLRRPGRATGPAEETCSGMQVHHILLYAEHAPRPLVGYAQLTVDAGPGAAELLVDPGVRRQGVGTALLRAVLDLAPAARVWAHGNNPAAQGFAAAQGMTVVRELWQMRRSLRADGPALPEVRLPAGFRARAFEPGRDEQAWLGVNGRAFAAHAEQGRMTRADLDDRMAESWFDPAGFILVEDVRESSAPGAHPLAAFHWTKVDPADGQPANGEVYVVGVDPAYQGKGLGRAVTVLGLEHLRALDLAAADLYVDGDNAAAVATYTALGFEQSAVDVMYASPDTATPRAARPAVAP